MSDPGDTFTQETSTLWIVRLGKSILGVLIGIPLIIAAIAISPSTRPRQATSCSWRFPGVKSAAEMFKTAGDENHFLTWVIRFDPQPAGRGRRCGAVCRQHGRKLAPAAAS
jgi:hypothetical protein